MYYQFPPYDRSWVAGFAMDEVNRDILRYLQENGRMSNLELARAIGLSPTPTLRRVRGLERCGAIRGYRAMIDPEAVQRSFQVLVWVDLVQGTRETIAALNAPFWRSPT
jgi:Lrp/AsnC family transcriptional regulator, leucine-responsive regulatory protein